MDDHFLDLPADLRLQKLKHWSQFLAELEEYLESTPQPAKEPWEEDYAQG